MSNNKNSAPLKGSVPVAEENKTNQNRPKGGAGPMGAGPIGGFGGGKAKNTKKALFNLSKYIGRLMPLIIISVVLAVLSAFVTISIPKGTYDIFNLIAEGLTPDVLTGIAPGINLQDVGKVGIYLAILIACGTISYVTQGFLMTEVTQRTGKRFRTDINKKINRLPLSYFDSQSFGDVLSRVTNDVDTITTSLSQSVTALIYAFTLLIGLTIVMFVYNWILAIVALATIPVSMLVIIIMVKISQKHFKNHQLYLGELNGHIEEIYSGHEVVRAYSGEAKAKQSFDRINEKLADAAWKGGFLSGLMHPIVIFIGNLGIVAVCVAGALLMVASDGIGAAGIFMFMLYVKSFTNPLSQLAQIMTSLQTAAAASERVFQFLYEPEMESEQGKLPAQIPDFKGRVEFKDVSFGYNSERTIIHSFSAVAESGQKIAIVGPTGAGKTTIVNLLMRFYEIGGGEILIDGVSTSTMTRAQVHSLFGMVLQDTWMFEGTIKENIVYAKRGATDEQVVDACKAAGIDHIIRALPNGYDMVMDDTSNLSAGEKQLITIARAIVENAPMLILDEATSAVDTRTEVLIQQAMDKLTVGRTSFIIAHRLSTIKNADLILVMKDGDIIEQGSHDALIAAGGFYNELYKSQFENV